MESSCSKLNYLRKQDEEVALFHFLQLCLACALLPTHGGIGWLGGLFPSRSRCSGLPSELRKTEAAFSAVVWQLGVLLK